MREVSAADIKAISPYTDEEFVQALSRTLQQPWLPEILQTYFPNTPVEKAIEIAKTVTNPTDFQKIFIGESLRSMLARSSNGQTISGLEQLNPAQKYLFISNHRDILLDSALFTRSILLNGFTTPKICLGDNLLVTPWIIDMVKMNKGITVKRDLELRELLYWSHVLSTLIYQQISEGIDSVWIAQREGRSKDGLDQTQTGVIKMLLLSGEGTIVERARRMRLVPVAISYEYEPCDHWKARERLLSSDGSYQKAPGEDLRSMGAGLSGFKGRIEIAVGGEIVDKLAPEVATLPKNEQIKSIVEAFDREIQRLYQLWPTNFIAYDLLEGGEKYRARYSEDEKRFFVDRMEKRLSKLEPALDARTLRRYFLELYANPVRTQSNTTPLK